MTTYARTHKPRTDTTKAERSARRRALLDVAAYRMAFDSWAQFETKVREAMERAATNAGAQSALEQVLSDSLASARTFPLLMFGTPADHPADVLAALAAHPKKQRAG